MKLPHFAIHRPVTIVMIVAAILVLGFVSITQLPIDLLPNMNIPILAIQTRYTNAGPHEIETLVTRPIEEVLGAVTSIKSVSSTSSRGTSTIIAQFDWGVNMDFASLDVRESVDLIKGMLPDDAGDPVILKFDPMTTAIMELVITGQRPLHELRHIAESTVKNRFERLEGVASVQVTGGEVREIKVELHPGLMQSFGITVDGIRQALQMANMDLPAGNVYDEQFTYLVRTTGEFKSVDEIGNVKLPTAFGGSVRLTDVADVIDGFKDVTQLRRFNGQPSVVIAVQKEAAANSLQVADRVTEAMMELNREFTNEVQLLVTQDTTVFITHSINAVTSNAVYGAFLAVFVLLLFLRSIRTTLVIIVAIPISVVATFVLMFLSNTSLNMISLGGLALGIGMLVDNGIVVLENIFRHRELGEDSFTAANQGTQEVGTAIIASTLTTISVFIPVIFVSGIAAEIFRDMVITVSFSLLVSLLISLTLVSMLASRLLGRVETNEKRQENRIQKAIGRVLTKLQNLYGQGIGWVLQHRLIIVVIPLALFAISLALLPRIGMEFLPGIDQGEISIRVQLPRGTQLRYTNAIVQQIEEEVAAIPDVRIVYSSIGGGASSNEHTGSVGIILVPLSDREKSTAEIVTYLREFVSGIPGATITVRASDMAMGALAGAPVQLNIRGFDLEEMERYALQIQERISQVPGLLETTNSMEVSDPEVQVIIHREKASDYGLSVGQIASTLRTSISGTTATYFRAGGQEIDVTIRLAEPWRREIRDIEKIPIPTARGVVPLEELASLEFGESPVSITRSEGSRTLSISGQVHGRPLNAVMDDVMAIIGGMTFPTEIQVVEGGENEQMTDAFDQLTMAMLLGVMLVFMVLASQFESLIQPFIIMFTLPLAAIGVIGGLLVYQLTFNVVAFVGIIMLAGIVVNNAIVLIDYINRLRAKGRERYEALVEAGKHRLRPILMTTLTTILAMVPLAIGVGEGTELQQPIAVVVIGGLLTSTLMTLFLIPILYSFVDDFSVWLMSRVFKVEPSRREENTTNIRGGVS